MMHVWESPPKPGLPYVIGELCSCRHDNTKEPQTKNTPSEESVAGIEFQSALSGQVLLTVDAERFDYEDSFLRRVQRLFHHRMHHPPFAVSCLHEGLVIEEDKAWVEFEGVSTFQVLLTPLTRNYAAELEVVIEQDCAVTTQDLLELGQDPTSTLQCGSTAVVKCCECNATAVLRKLLEGKADPDRIGLDGRNPLDTAVSAQNYGAVKTLLLHGANANLQDAEGNAATHVVARVPDADMLGLLMGHGASLLLENHQGQCWFSLADLCQFAPFAVDSACKQSPGAMFCAVISNLLRLLDCIGSWGQRVEGCILKQTVCCLLGVHKMCKVEQSPCCKRIQKFGCKFVTTGPRLSPGAGKLHSPSRRPSKSSSMLGCRLSRLGTI